MNIKNYENRLSNARTSFQAKTTLRRTKIGKHQCGKKVVRPETTTAGLLHLTAVICKEFISHNSKYNQTCEIN